MRTGILGGTFDPIHTGHLILAETVLSDLGLDRILFVPASSPPHKREEPISDPQDRFTMVRLATDGHLAFGVSDCELVRGGTSYTIDTLSDLKSIDAYARDEFFLIVGADNLIEVHTWKNPERIFESAMVIGLRRPGCDIGKASEPFRSRMRIVDAPLISISGSEIRARVRNGRSIRYWVPEAVADYIARKGLYRP